MAALMEPDINPINTDCHATTYFTANATYSLDQTLLILSESLPPTVNTSQYSKKLFFRKLQTEKTKISVGFILLLYKLY